MKIYYCEECGQTFLRKTKPKKCNSKIWIKKCKSTKIKRILTEDDK